IFIPVLEMADEVAVQDPAIGDDLSIVPLYKPGDGVAIGRDFIEFSLLETSQGMAVAKKADEVALTEVRDGVRVSMPRGATLTPGLPEVTAATPKVALQSTGTFFPYEAWKFDQNSNWREGVRDLLHHIAESKTIDKANQARLRLAQYYLSEGMAPEA